MGRRLAIAVAVAFAALPAAAHGQHTKVSLESVGPAGGNGAFPADVTGVLDGGSRVLVSTGEPLTADDTDAALDVYSRGAGTTTLHSAGVTGGNGAFPATYAGARRAGARVFFQTDEQLVGTDTDNSLDVYARVASTTTLISTGPGAGATGAFDAYFAGASADGTRAFFSTRGSLTAGDTDASTDVYERAGGSTALVSTGPAGGNGTPGAELVGLSDDGARAFFHTNEPLVAGDTDVVQDVYEQAGGVTTLVSTGPAGGNGSDPASYADSSLDGTKVFFHTRESLLASDTDDGVDVYERAGGATSIHSVGPSGGNGNGNATLAGISEDGSTVFIDTVEKLIPNPVDRDTQNDVYRSAGGSLTLVSPGGNDTVATPAYLAAASADGSRAFIRSEEALVAGDTDKYQDVYEYTGGGLTRVSLGPAGGNGPMHASLGGISDDGTRVFFETYESLDASDADSSADVYERHAGATHHLSRGATGGNGVFDATVRAVSPGGERVFFRTAESLLPADTDGVADVYSANVPASLTVVLDSLPDDPQDFGFTTAGGLAPPAFQLDDDSDGSLSNTRAFGDLSPGGGYSVAQTLPTGWSQVSAVCDDGSPPAAIDLEAGEAVTCTFVNQRGYVRPRNASPVKVSLVPAYAQCVSPNRTHGPTLTFPSCAPPQQTSLYLTTGTPDVNAQTANMSSGAQFLALSGDGGTATDEADVVIGFTVNDVRVRPTLADYPGELVGTVMLRVTDRLNGPAQNEAGTVSDMPLSFTIPCAISADVSTGAACSIATSADAVLPGMVSEAKRTIWAMEDVGVSDGGPDGQASTPGNTLFLKQGLFVP